YPDPTAPLSTMLWNSDEVRPETWWAVGPPREAYTQSALVTVDPEGTEWFVVDGMFRHSAPSRTDPPTMPTPRLGRTRWMMREDDGRPQPGRARHEVVHVEKARLRPQLNPAGDATSHHDHPRSFYAQKLSTLSPEGELVSTSYDTDPDPLSADLLQLLDARWTGWGIDCIDAQDELVITDPARRSNAPQAVLVRADALRRAIERPGHEIQANVTVTDLHSVHRLGSIVRTTAITIRQSPRPP